MEGWGWICGVPSEVLFGLILILVLVSCRLWNPKNTTTAYCSGDNAAGASGAAGSIAVGEADLVQVMAGSQSPSSISTPGSDWIERYYGAEAGPSAPLLQGQPEDGSGNTTAASRPLAASDIERVRELLQHTNPRIEQKIRDIHEGLRTRRVGAHQAERLWKYLRSATAVSAWEIFSKESLTDLRELRDSGKGTEAHLRREWNGK
ncbi:hypothetical protein E2562_036273 [Oryza meyeriana var. granulata]|uniref:Uncharacterized protein n=1 Tax=Oryza meyeriana var. granulata TaxID=110450 RepID=A0A6G1DSQ3_9ORYZ|nr:hypothetical protein E2562_036273 [Oryza meyeriana var. granulata]